MKNQLFVFGILAAHLALCSLVACASAPESGQTNVGYSWTLAVPPGNGRFPETCREGNWPMGIIPLPTPDNKLWMIGRTSVWSSTDGTNWSAQAKTDWGERAGQSYAFFNAKFWMLGGMTTWDDFRNDVWSSPNGTDWSQATARADWAPRRNHGAVVFNNKLWVIGGAQSSGRPDQVPTRFFNDVWASEDGVQWSQITAAAPWLPRDGHACLVFNDRLWLIGGTGLRDVWNSSDGRNWTQVTPKAPWKARHSNGAAVFDGHLWVFGGRGLNDVWSSTDGADWHIATAHAPWSSRTTIHSTVFAEKLWIYGGKTGRADSWAGDVWTMSRPR